MLLLSQKYKVSYHTFSSSKVIKSYNLHPCSAKTSADSQKLALSKIAKNHAAIEKMRKIRKDVGSEASRQAKHF